MRRRVISIVLVLYLLVPQFITTAVQSRSDEGLWIEGIQQNPRPTNGVATIKGFTGKITVTESSYEFDLVCDLVCEIPVDKMQWYVATSELAIKRATLDDREIKSRSDKGNFFLEFPQKMQTGAHKLRFIYDGTMNYASPEGIRTQIFTNGYHFHCYNAWYPMSDSISTDKQVTFNLDVKIPSHWFLLGSFVPKEYRDKPKSDGKYKVEIKTENIYAAKLVGGDYIVFKEDGEKYAVRVYGFRGGNTSFKTILKTAKSTADFFGQYYNKPCENDYFVAAQTGRRGNGQGLDGGWVIDSPYLNEESFAPDFLAHECAHLSWFGGNGVIPNPKVHPDQRVLSESFAEFSAILYCNSLSPEQGQAKLKSVREIYFKNKKDYEPPLSSTACEWVDYIVYEKGALVVWALKGKLGDDVFKSAMQEFMKKYDSSKQAPGEGPTLKDLKTTLEEVSGIDLTDFWSVFFNSPKLVSTSFGLLRGNKDGKIIDTLSLKNNDSTEYPTNFRVYYVDGESQSFVLTGKTKLYQLPKIATGIVFTDYNGIIPMNDDRVHSMSTANIISLLKWQRPLVCYDPGDGEDVMKRAEAWVQKYGGESITSNFSGSTERPVILIGPTPQMKVLGSAKLGNRMVKVQNDSIVWRGKQIMGEFDGIQVFYDEAEPAKTYILDNGLGNLPENLAFTGIFTRRDKGCMLSFNLEKPGIPMATLGENILDPPWMQGTVELDSFKQTFTINSKREYRAAWKGFDRENFTFKEMTQTIKPGQNNISIELDTRGGKCAFEIEHSSIFCYEKWCFGLQTASSECPLPELQAPKSSQNSDWKASFNQNLDYSYSLDGAKGSNWIQGRELILSGLQKGKHELKIIFACKGGALSEIQTANFATGAVPPKVTINPGAVVQKKGEVVLSGKADPGARLSFKTPQGKELVVDISQKDDGAFTATIKETETLTEIIVTATDENGLSATARVMVTKYVMVTMQIGSKTATSDDGATYTLDVPPMILAGSTFVPMRFIGERLSAEITWVASEKKVIYKLGKTIVEIWIGKKEAKVNGAEYKLASSPVIVSGKTLVPLRFVAEALGAKVTWQGETKTIIIEYPNL